MGREDASVKDLYEASAYLTGYDEMALRGTGLGPTYRDVVEGSEWAPKLEALAAKALEVGRTYADPMKRANALKTEVLDDDDLGPLAQNIVMLWFLGTWADNAADLEAGSRHTVSDHAYVEGLVWNDMGAHPQAAKWPGWGTWAWKPRGTWA